MNNNFKLNPYQVTAVTTVLAVVFLIFVGGLVRASGSGLGCPDWPKCFGMWIPPTSAAELPPAFEPSQFNVIKTWTEYINRLIGVVIGLLITATFLLSFRFRKEKPAVFYSSGAAFIMVLVQGWLGGQVVITGLDAWLITLHMLLAMAIMATLIYAAWKASEEQFSVEAAAGTKRLVFWSGLVLLVFTLAQLVLGTQVREAVDAVKNAAEAIPRELWLERVGQIDEIHRTFSWTLFLAGGFLFYLCRWRSGSRLLARLGSALFGVILLQIALGAGLYYLGMPPGYQVLHLAGIAVMIGLEMVLLLSVKGKASELN